MLILKIKIMFSEKIQDAYKELIENPDSFDERKRLILSFPVYNIPNEIQDDILEAYDYFLINPESFDGSTGSKENWVSEYEPASLRHDLDYQIFGGTQKGRIYSDLKFLDYKERYEISALWRNIQFFAIRWGGYYFQLKNKLKGNINDVPKNKLLLAPNELSLTQIIIEVLGIITIIPFAVFFVGAFVMDIKHAFNIGKTKLKNIFSKN